MLGPLGAIAAIGLEIYYLRRQWLRRPAPLGPEHVSRWTPVKLLAFKREWVELGLRNETYAKELVRLNSKPSGGAANPS